MLKFRAMRSLLLLLVLASVAIAQSAVELSAEPHHHLVLQNESVRAFTLDLPPRESTLLHRHSHDYIYVVFSPAEVENTVEGKSPVQLKFQPGDARSLDGNFAHTARNLSATPFREVVVELLQDEKARKTPPPKWDEERGLSVFDRGTKDILFVKDGVRVSEIELQPGGMIPSHHHDGPHLLIAVCDLEVRSDVEGKGPMPGHFKAGDVKWLPGGYTHTLTNVGKQPAKFVTLEFH
jgi:quercetin dioxygenase-like cupin family protein